MKYVCAICKKEHDNIDSYLKCVTSCTKKVKDKEAAEKKARAEAEAKAKKAKEEKEIKEIITEICEKKQQYYSAVNKLKSKYPHAYISYQFDPMMSLAAMPTVALSNNKPDKNNKAYVIHDDFFDALEKLIR